MIAIPELGNNYHQLWVDLMVLSEEARVPWTLIGAHMVTLHGWEAGELDRVTPQGIGHRFRHGPVRFDVLAPDGIGQRTSIRTIGRARTVEVPGGTQALRRSERVDVRSRSKRGTVHRPDLLGALLVKVRAIAVDDSPDAQRQDVAFLLSLVKDPEPLISDMTGRERTWLRRHRYFADPGSPCWTRNEEAEEGVLAYRRLADIEG